MNPTDYTDGFTRPLGDGQDPESAPDGPDTMSVTPKKWKKTRTPYAPGRIVPLGIEPYDVQKVELSISDADLDEKLAEVGEQLLCLCPADAVKLAVGFEIPGRNSYAVKFGLILSTSYWPGEHNFVLLTVPDTVTDQVLPPEYVKMLQPVPLVQFEVKAGI